jgi:hypothetical protein
MIGQNASPTLLLALLENDTRYVEGSQMKFSSITIENTINNTVITMIAEDGTKLATFTGPKVDLDKGQIITFRGFTGYMECNLT